MNETIGTSQTSIGISVNTITAENLYFTRFVSPPLPSGVTSISANTWTYNFATLSAGLSSNFPVNGTAKPVYVNCYVWRPSTSTKIGTILDGNTASTVDEGTSLSEFAHHVAFTGSSVGSIQTDDVIVFEVWFQIQQINSTAKVATFYFDGTTETTTEGTIVSNHASFLETPQTLAGTTPLSQTSIHKYNLLQYVPQTTINKYNMRQYQTQTSIHKYNLRVFVSITTTIQKYNLRKFLSHTSIHKYNLKQLLASTSIHKYNLRKFLAQTTIQKYNLRAFVAITTSIQKYNLKRNILQSSIQKYNLKRFITQTTIQKYNLRQNVAQTTIHKYKLVARVLVTSIHKYNLLFPGTLVVSIIHKYHIRVFLSQTSRHKYTLRNFVAVTTSVQKYNLRRLVAVTTSIHKYSLRAFLSQISVQKYNLRAYVLQTSRHKYHLGFVPEMDMTEASSKTYANKFITKV